MDSTLDMAEVVFDDVHCVFVHSSREQAPAGPGLCGVREPRPGPPGSSLASASLRISAKLFHVEMRR
jgi:hypothetical protein